MTDNELKAWIKKCEALRLRMYVDTTGNPTIGWGRNLTNGISVDEADLMFQNDYSKAISELTHFKWYSMQPLGVKAALINMAFNLGIEKLLGFKKMIDALTFKNYSLAAIEALDSLWAKQVGERAKDVAMLIREGK
jgi:lysozyme